MLIYLDSSALVKRVLDEAASPQLAARLEELERGGNELLTSTLSWVEVTRALKSRCERLGLDSLEGRDAQALSGIAGFPVSYEVIALARRIGPQSLRSLDAIHCATATLVDADMILAYDERLLRSAKQIGLAVESPGVETAGVETERAAT